MPLGISVAEVYPKIAPVGSAEAAMSIDLGLMSAWPSQRRHDG